MSKIARMPTESLVHNVWRVPARCFLQSALVIFFQRWAKMGVGAFLNDKPCPLSRRQASKVGKTLLRDNDLDVVLSMIDMTDHWHDARDCSALRD